MEAIPDGFVLIQIHMPPEVLEDLRAAACAAGMPIEDWLIRLLARGVARGLTGARV